MLSDDAVEVGVCLVWNSLFTLVLIDPSGSYYLASHFMLWRRALNISRRWKFSLYSTFLSVKCKCLPKRTCRRPVLQNNKYIKTFSTQGLRENCWELLPCALNHFWTKKRLYPPQMAPKLQRLSLKFLRGRCFCLREDIFEGHGFYGF